jgi:hypothetical protein
MRSATAQMWRSLARPGLLKVPELTLLFWVIKLLSTAMGESTSDFLVFRINPYVAVVTGCLGLVVALVLQLRAPRYSAWIYWLAIVMVAVFGTMAADVMHVVLGIPYLVSTVMLASLLAVVFIAWYVVERTLSIHTIRTPRRELFYWATVMPSGPRRAISPPRRSISATPVPCSCLPSCSPFRVSATASRAGTKSPPSGPPTSSPDRSAPQSPIGSASQSWAGSVSATSTSRLSSPR